MFNKVFIEQDLSADKKMNQRVQDIMHAFKVDEPIYIERIEEHWGRQKKPYLQKRTNLNLYLGKKRGQLVKQTPEAYGTGQGSHYYFIHAYNCIYECQYCYLQGYFHTPDIVLFLNHEEIIEQMQTVYDERQRLHPGEQVWFHAGEFSDSLALSHVTKEWPVYWSFFENNPHAYLELRTKSTNTKSVLELKPNPRIITTFSLSPKDESKEFDLKTPSLKARFSSLQKLADQGHYYGLHLDPIIYKDNFQQHYQELAQMISSLPQKQLSYISIGVVRFTKDVFQQVRNNYPDSSLLAQSFPKSFDNKVRYSKPMRMWILNTVKEQLLAVGVDERKIYLCME